MMIAWILATLVSVVVVPRSAAAGERFLAQPKLATNCQSALIAATTPFAQKKLKQLDKCAGAVFKCLQTVAHNFDADVDPVDACLEKASLRCVAATDVITAEEQRLTDAITKGCAALDPADLLRADGVGYELIAPDCLDFGVTLGDTASVAECIMQQHECAIEQIYLAEHPRAGELFDLTDADLGPDSCLDDLGGPGEGVDDVKLGRQVAQCQQGVTNAGGAFVGAKLKSVGRCLDAVFTCVQLAAHDDGTCLAKAQKTCDSAFAAVEKSARTVEPAIGKSCGAIPFDTLAADTGVDYQALIDDETCVDFGVSGIATVPHYAICTYRRTECASDDIMRFTAPRAQELLALVNRTLPGSFFCIPPDDEF
jgi:hypothetical protein